MKILTRTDLNIDGCIIPDCDHKDHSEMYIVCLVHPESEVAVRYIKPDGVLEILCKECSIEADNYTPIMRVGVMR